MQEERGIYVGHDGDPTIHMLNPEFNRENRPVRVGKYGVDVPLADGSVLFLSNMVLEVIDEARKDS